MKENTKINITADGVKEVLIREGVAPAINEPLAHSYNGTINTPSQFLNKNKGQALPGLTVVEADKDAGVITMYLNKADKLAAVITGSIKAAPTLQEFKINDGYKFSTKELTNHLRMRKIYFADKDKCKTVVENLMNYKATVTMAIEQQNNLKGEKRDLFETKLAHGLNLDFVAMMPIFKGQENKSFTVDIMCDVTDGGVVFWLESEELEALKIKEREQIVNDELFKLTDYAIIYK